MVDGHMIKCHLFNDIANGTLEEAQAQEEQTSEETK